jgi:hypothetical protein
MSTKRKAEPKRNKRFLRLRLPKRPAGYYDHKPGEHWALAKERARSDIAWANGSV